MQGLRGAYERAIKLCYALSVLGSIPIVIMPMANILLPLVGQSARRGPAAAAAVTAGGGGAAGDALPRGGGAASDASSHAKCVGPPGALRGAQRECYCGASGVEAS